jgi:hypothetical protein
VGGTRFMPASTLTKRSGALTTKSLRQALRRLRTRKAFKRPLLANVSRQKHEGVDDLQFNLLSVGAGKGPRAAQDEFYKRKGGNERYHL